MFSKILIANRGEVAVRVIRACKEMGVETVGVFSSADRDALHVALADESYCIGGPRPQDSYLNKEAILTVAIESGATAIHPGYGFLAENAEFARMCRECGVVFVGPTPEVIERMGNKDMARVCAREANVPLADGCDLLSSADQTEAEARRIGCPVLIKARAGGGGRGIRRVDSPEAARSAYQEAYAEALAAFGDGECYMEKFVEHAHHVEVQLLCDVHGNALAVGERECSVQRRNQKLLEESPSPSVDPEARAQMQAAAVRLAKRMGYTGVGTIEFLYTDDGRFYFMEMNTRLQVEHPVTEMVSGLDLVKWQLRCAAGEHLPFNQDDIRIAGHAIECRINAETADFLPSSGKISMLHAPNGPWVRFDSALYQGCTVPPYYDSLLGKLIVHAPTREEAVRKMRSAIGELAIEGVDDNSELQLDILNHPEFLGGVYHTDLMGHLYGAHA